MQHCHNEGATITFIDNDIDTASSSGRLVLQILGAIAEAVMRVLAGESQNRVRESLGLSPGLNQLLRNPRLAGMTPKNEGKGHKYGSVVMVNDQPLIKP